MFPCFFCCLLDAMLIWKLLKVPMLLLEGAYADLEALEGAYASSVRRNADLEALEGAYASS